MKHGDQTYTSQPACHFITGPAEWKRIAQLGEDQLVKRNGYVVKPGTKPDSVYVLMEGALASQEIQGEGETVTCNLFLKSSLLFESSAIVGSKPREVRYLAIEDSHLSRIPEEVLRQAVHDDATLGPIVIESLFKKMNIARDQIRDFHNHDAVRRILSLITEMVDHRGYNEDDGIWRTSTLRISQQTMADLLCMNRVTVAKGLRSLKEQGVVKKTGGFYSIRK